MMNLPDIIVLSIFLILLISIVLISKQKNLKPIDFALDGQKSPSILVFASLTASFLGPGFTLGLSEQGYQTGLLLFFVYLGFSLQNVLVGLFVAPKLREYRGAQTMGDIMGYHYGQLARIITGLLSLLFCIGIIGLISYITGTVLDTAFGVPRTIGSLFGTLIVVIYTMFWGMKTVSYTDILQFVFFTIVIPIFLLSIFFRTNNLSNIIALLPEKVLHPFNYVSNWQFWGMFIGFVLGETLIPASANRALIAKNSQAAKRGFILSGFYSIIWFGMCITIGILASHFIPNIAPESTFIAMGKHFLQPGLFGLLIAGILSIIMSTQDSYLNAASVVFVRDIIGTFKPDISDKSYLRYAKVVTLIIGLLGILFALQLNGILNGIMINYTLWGPTMVLPIVFAVFFKKRINPLGGLIGIFFGIIGVVLWEWVLNKPFEIPSLIPGLILNILGIVVFGFMIKKIPSWKILKSSSGIQN